MCPPRSRSPPACRDTWRPLPCLTRSLSRCLHRRYATIRGWCPTKVVSPMICNALPVPLTMGISISISLYVYLLVLALVPPPPQTCATGPRRAWGGGCLYRWDSPRGTSRFSIYPSIRQVGDGYQAQIAASVGRPIPPRVHLHRTRQAHPPKLPRPQPHALGRPALPLPNAPQGSSSVTKELPFSTLHLSPHTHTHRHRTHTRHPIAHLSPRSRLSSRPAGTHSE
jgi:hypothetical protein